MLGGSASYAGDARFTGSQSAPVTEKVNQVVTPLPPPQDGPTVVSLLRTGYHRQPTVLLLSFNEAVDAARAQSPSTYRIIDPIGRTISVKSALYNSVTRTDARNTDETIAPPS